MMNRMVVKEPSRFRIKRGILESVEFRWFRLQTARSRHFLFASHGMGESKRWDPNLAGYFSRSLIISYLTGYILASGPLENLSACGS